MMKLATYNIYKSSGVEWLKQIPVDWEIKRVKDFFRLVTDKAPDNNDYELLSIYTNIGVRPRKDLEQRGNKSVTTDGYWLVKKNDIIVNKLLAWMGAIGLSNYEGVTSPAYDILRRKNSMDERYFAYLFRTKICQSEFKKNSRGIMEVRLRLYFDKFGALSMPFPSSSRQTLIANYLDQATSKIDKKIDLLTQKIKHYQDLKTAVINSVVTKGLDDSVEMKDSGVEWVGKIPKHWEVKRMKDIGYLYSGLSGKKGDDFRKDDSPLNRPFIKFTNISNDIIVETKNFGQVEIESDETQNKVQKGDIFFLMSSEGYEDIGKSALLNEELDEVYLNSFCKGFRISNKSIIPSYLNFLLASDDIRHNIICEGKGFTRINLRMSKIQCLNFLAPPIIEQQKIVEYLNKKTSIIDKIIATITKQIEHQKELRKTLINDVVTGKVKVENS